MQNVCTRGKSRTFYVKKDIPHDVRPAFGGKAQVWRSLGTTNKIEAIAKAHPILAEIEAKIVAAREPQTAQPVPTQTPTATSGLLKRDQLLAAVETWRVETIGRAHDAFFNGAADTFEDFGLEDMAHSERLYRLQQRQWSEIDGFDQRMVEALLSRGLAVSLEHPALTHIRNDFGAAWHDVESFTRQFRRGEFDGWPEDGSEAPAASVRPPTSALRGAGGVADSPSARGAPLTLTELLERFIISKLTAKKKAQALSAHGALRCEVCSFDFAERYGEHGARFIEAHHRKPVSTLKAGEKTRLDDLALVCANCHRMLHRGTVLLGVDDLRALLRPTGLPQAAE